MLLKELIQQVDLSRRAVKYYEEQGLLKVEKDENGYRNYSEENLLTLKEISAYRKLGIGIADIRTLLKHEDRDLLEKIYEEKAASLLERKKELDALEKFLDNQNVEELYSTVDYATVGDALLDMAPGCLGYVLLQHFLPYLDIPITTKEQKEAYDRLLHFLDHTRIRIPLFYRLLWFFLKRENPALPSKLGEEALANPMEKYLNPTEEEYEAFKEQIKQAVSQRNRFPARWNPLLHSQRTLMKRLKAAGYYDLFLPAMVELSPKYREYRDALERLNQRVTADLGLYYDSGYRILSKTPLPSSNSSTDQ